jgi:four helix bundle protein|tara:strand:+ start:224 stop:583 length:360 start_codon:yes stop_codon:yes gene_type:complete
MAREYKRLKVWERSVKFCKKISDLIDSFPRKEDWALSSQLRRAVISIPSNIAEGCGRNSKKDTVRFLDIALGSVNEVVTQLYIAKEFGYVDDAKLIDLDNELDEIGKMLMGFIAYVSKG